MGLVFVIGGESSVDVICLLGLTGKNKVDLMAV